MLRRTTPFIVARGERFDPGMVDAFVKIHEESRAIAHEFADVEGLREVLSQ